MSGKNSFLKLDPGVVDYQAGKKRFQYHQPQSTANNPKSYSTSNKFLELKSKFGSSFNQPVINKNSDIATTNNKKHTIVSRSVSPHDIIPRKQNGVEEEQEKKKKV